LTDLKPNDGLSPSSMLQRPIQLHRALDDASLPCSSHQYCRVASNVVNVELAAVGANALGRTAAFPSRRPVLADQCRSRQGGLLTMRVQLHECSSAQKFRAHSRRYGSCGYRHALQIPARDAPAFACSSFALTDQE